MSRPKDVGTKAETAVVRLLRAAGLAAERRALAGSADQGDIWVNGGRAVLEVKSRNRPVTLAEVESWLVETERECIHAMAAGAPADFCALVVKRPGSGPANAADWTVYARPCDAAWLLAGVQIADATGWVAMRLGDVADRLRGRWAA